MSTSLGDSEAGIPQPAPGPDLPPIKKAPELYQVERTTGGKTVRAYVRVTGTTAWDAKRIKNAAAQALSRVEQSDAALPRNIARNGERYFTVTFNSLPQGDVGEHAEIKLKRVALSKTTQISYTRAKDEIKTHGFWKFVMNHIPVIGWIIRKCMGRASSSELGQEARQFLDQASCNNYQGYAAFLSSMKNMFNNDPFKACCGYAERIQRQDATVAKSIVTDAQAGKPVLIPLGYYQASSIPGQNPQFCTMMATITKKDGKLQIELQTGDPNAPQKAVYTIEDEQKLETLLQALIKKTVAPQTSSATSEVERLSRIQQLAMPAPEGATLTQRRDPSESWNAIHSILIDNGCTVAEGTVAAMGREPTPVSLLRSTLHSIAPESSTNDKTAVLLELLSTHIQNFLHRITEFSESDQQAILKALLQQHTEINEHLKDALGSDITVEKLAELEIEPFPRLQEDIQKAKARLQELNQAQDMQGLSRTRNRALANAPRESSTARARVEASLDSTRTRGSGQASTITHSLGGIKPTDIEKLQAALADDATRASDISGIIDTISSQISRMVDNHEYALAAREATKILNMLPVPGEGARFWPGLSEGDRTKWGEMVTSLAQCLWESKLKLGDTHSWTDEQLAAINAQAIQYELITARGKGVEQEVAAKCKQILQVDNELRRKVWNLLCPPPAEGEQDTRVNPTTFTEAQIIDALERNTSAEQKGKLWKLLDLPIETYSDYQFYKTYIPDRQGLNYLLNFDHYAVSLQPEHQVQLAALQKYYGTSPRASPLSTRQETSLDTGSGQDFSWSISRMRAGYTNEAITHADQVEAYKLAMAAYNRMLKDNTCLSPGVQRLRAMQMMTRSMQHPEIAFYTNFSESGGLRGKSKLLSWITNVKQRAKALARTPADELRIFRSAIQQEVGIRLHQMGRLKIVMASNAFSQEPSLCIVPQDMAGIDDEIAPGIVYHPTPLEYGSEQLPSLYNPYNNAANVGEVSTSFVRARTVQAGVEVVASPALLGDGTDEVCRTEAEWLASSLSSDQMPSYAYEILRLRQFVAAQTVVIPATDERPEQTIRQIQQQLHHSTVTNTLDFIVRHPELLSQDGVQRLLEANLFRPPLLQQALQENPEAMIQLIGQLKQMTVSAYQQQDLSAAWFLMHISTRMSAHIAAARAEAQSTLLPLKDALTAATQENQARGAEELTSITPPDTEASLRLLLGIELRPKPINFENANQRATALNATLENVERTLSGLTQKENAFKAAVRSRQAIESTLGNLNARLRPLNSNPSRTPAQDREKQEIEAHIANAERDLAGITPIPLTDDQTAEQAELTRQINRLKIKIKSIKSLLPILLLQEAFGAGAPINLENAITLSRKLDIEKLKIAEQIDVATQRNDLTRKRALERRLEAIGKKLAVLHDLIKPKMALRNQYEAQEKSIRALQRSVVRAETATRLLPNLSPPVILTHEAPLQLPSQLANLRPRNPLRTNLDMLAHTIGQPQTTQATATEKKNRALASMYFLDAMQERTRTHGLASISTENKSLMLDAYLTLKNLPAGYGITLLQRQGCVWMSEVLPQLMSEARFTEQVLAPVLTRLGIGVEGLKQVGTTAEFKNKAGQSVNLASGEIKGIRQQDAEVSLPNELLTHPDFQATFGAALQTARVRTGERAQELIYEATFQGRGFRIEFDKASGTVRILQDFGTTNTPKWCYHVQTVALNAVHTDVLLERHGLWVNEANQREAFALFGSITTRDETAFFRVELSSSGAIERITNVRDRDLQVGIDIRRKATAHLSCFHNNRVLFLRRGSVTESITALGHNITLVNQNGRFEAQGDHRGFHLVDAQERGALLPSSTQLLSRIGREQQHIILPLAQRTEEVQEDRLLLIPHRIATSTQEAGQTHLTFDMQADVTRMLPPIPITSDGSKIDTSCSGFLYLAYIAAAKKNYKEALLYLEEAGKRPLAQGEQELFETIASYVQSLPATSTRPLAFQLKAELLINNIRRLQLQQSGLQLQGQRQYLEHVRKLSDLFSRYEAASRTGRALSPEMQLSTREMQEYRHIVDEAFTFLVEPQQQVERAQETAVSQQELGVLIPILVAFSGTGAPRNLDIRQEANASTKLLRFLPHFAEQILNSDPAITTGELAFLLGDIHLAPEENREEIRRAVGIARKFLLQMCDVRNQEETLKAKKRAQIAAFVSQNSSLIAKGPRLEGPSITKDLTATNLLKFFPQYAIQVLNNNPPIEDLKKILGAIERTIPDDATAEFRTAFGNAKALLLKLQDVKEETRLEEARDDLVTHIRSLKTRLPEVQPGTFLSSIARLETVRGMTMAENMRGLTSGLASRLRRCTLSGEAEEVSVVPAAAAGDPRAALLQRINASSLPESEKIRLRQVVEKLQTVEGSALITQLVEQKLLLQRRQAELENRIRRLEAQAVEPRPAPPLESPITVQKNSWYETAGIDAHFKPRVAVARDINTSPRLQISVDDPLAAMRGEEIRLQNLGNQAARLTFQNELNDRVEIKSESTRLALLQQVSLRKSALQTQVATNKADCLSRLERMRSTPEVRALLRKRAILGDEAVFEQLLLLYQRQGGTGNAQLDQKITETLLLGCELKLLTKAEAKLKKIGALIGTTDPVKRAELQVLSTEIKQLIKSGSNHLRYSDPVTGVLQNPRLTKKFLVAEYRRGIVMREGQIEIIKQLLTNPNLLLQLRMGLGKTSYVLPIILQLLAEEGIDCFALVPAALKRMNRRDMDTTTREFWDQAAFEVNFSDEVLHNSTLLAQEYERLLQAGLQGSYPIGTLEDIAAIKLRHRELSQEIAVCQRALAAPGISDEKKAALTEQLRELQKINHWLCKIEARFKSKKTQLIADEADELYTPNSMINRTTGESRAPNATIRLAAKTIIGKHILEATDQTPALYKLKMALLKRPPTNATLSKLEIRAALVEAARKFATDQVPPIDAAGFVAFVFDNGPPPANMTSDMDAVRKILHPLLADILSRSPEIDFGIQSSTGCTTGPRRDRQEKLNTNFGDEYELVLYNYIQYTTNGPSPAFLESAVRAMRMRSDARYTQLSQDAGCTDAMLPQDKDALIVRYLRNLQEADVTQVAQWRLDILENDVLAAGKITLAPKQFTLNVQDITRGYQVRGISGTMSPDSLPDDFVVPEGSDDTARSVEGETYLKLAHGLPQGLDTVLPTVPDHAVLDRIVVKLNESMRVKSVINIGFDIQGKNVLDIITDIRKRCPNRSFVFVHPTERKAYIWPEGEHSLPRLLEREPIPENAVVWFDPADKRGTDFVIPPGEAIVIPSATATGVDYAQGLFRMRGLGFSQTATVLCPESLAERIRQRKPLKDAELGALPLASDVLGSLLTYNDLFNDVQALTVEQAAQKNMKAELLRIRGIAFTGLENILYTPPPESFDSAALNDHARLHSFLFENMSGPDGWFIQDTEVQFSIDQTREVNVLTRLIGEVDDQVAKLKTLHAKLSRLDSELSNPFNEEHGYQHPLEVAQQVDKAMEEITALITKLEAKKTKYQLQQRTNQPPVGLPTMVPQVSPAAQGSQVQVSQQQQQQQQTQQQAQAQQIIEVSGGTPPNVVNLPPVQLSWIAPIKPPRDDRDAWNAINRDPQGIGGGQIETMQSSITRFQHLRTLKPRVNVTDSAAVLLNTAPTWRNKGLVRLMISKDPGSDAPPIRTPRSRLFLASQQDELGLSQEIAAVGDPLNLSRAPSEGSYHVASYTLGAADAPTAMNVLTSQAPQIAQEELSLIAEAKLYLGASLTQGELDSLRGWFGTLPAAARAELITLLGQTTTSQIADNVQNALNAVPLPVLAS